MWLTRRDRITLAWLGLLALVALGLLSRQRNHSLLSLVSPAEPTQVAHWDEAIVLAGQIDVNGADASELIRLPGVGPALAKRIAEHRAKYGRFHRAEDLMEVPGVGPKTLEQLREHITIR